MTRQATLGSAISSTELVNVGSNFCLFRRDNHALALVNQSAANMLLSCFDDVDTRAFEPRLDPHDATHDNGHDQLYIDMLMAQLRSEGFLNVPAPRVVAPGVATGFRTTSNPKLNEVYRLAVGPAVRLVCEDAELSRLLAAALQPLQARRHSGHQIEIVVTVEDKLFGVWRDGIAIVTQLESSIVRRICLQAVLMAMLPSEEVAALLHASTVSIAGRAVILAGATGSGKTTLMMALIGSGAAYLADDLTPLHPSGRAVSNFPLAASVKKGSWSVLARLFPRLEDCRVYHVGDRQVRYIDPAPAPAPAIATSIRSAPVGALVFPAFDPDLKDVSMGRIQPEEALSQLLEPGSEVVGAQHSIKPVTTLVNETPSWNLTFGDLRSGAEAVQAAAGVS